MSTEEFSLKELNKPTDWKNLTGMAKKHVPIIEAPAKVKANEPFAVKIKVGGIDGVEHPNTLSHWINWITLYAGKRLIARVDFGAELTDKYVVTVNVTLTETTTLIAQEFCNLHGVWEGKDQIVTVE
ncbi:MAG: class II SORL domain-containing protein [Candidatus Bathyarchaeia archaeon]